MSTAQSHLAGVIDLGASLPPPEPQPDGGVREYRSGGGLKIRVFDVTSRQEIAEYPNPDGSDAANDLAFRRSIAEKPPDVFFQLAAKQITEFLTAKGMDPGCVTHLINGFPAFIADNTAAHVANLLYLDDGQWLHWSKVNIGEFWRNAFAGSPLNPKSIRVVNDLVLGIGIYLMEHKDDLKEGDHVIFIMTGGGCGVAEGLCIGANGDDMDILIIGTEQGHCFFVPVQSLPVTRHQPERLEAGFSSAIAIERNYKRLTGENCECREVIARAAAGDPDALWVVHRYVEGLAYLTSLAVTRGVTRIVIIGPVATGINEAFAYVCKDYIQTQIRDHFMQIARRDMIASNNVRFDYCDARDNTRGGIALLHARDVAPKKGGLLMVRRRDL